MSERFRSYLDDYATYHRDSRNKVTHYLGIPMIVLAIVCLLARVPLGEVGGVSVDLALVVTIPVCLFYLSLNLFSGAAMTLLFALMYWTAPAIEVWLAWALFVVGWVFQFVGHKFEGKSPAFFRNAVHLLIGPLWILNDLLAKCHLPAHQPKGA